MSEVRTLPLERLGRDFIPGEFLPAGCDEYYLRNLQAPKPAGYWRHLHSEEIETLIRNGNTCQDWSQVLVADPFNVHLVKDSQFAGLVRLGRLENVFLEHHDLQVPAGITDSRIVSCDLGNNVAVHNVGYLAHYILGDRVILLNISEMHVTNHAKFGNGIVKHGEPEDVRVWLQLANEAGGRAVMPFDGMIPADAYLWAKYREDDKLLARLGELTQGQFDARRGYYGTVGDECVIKHCRILKDVKIGSHCYIKGANKLKNLTIHSNEAEQTQIGEGVELVNGIVGLGCHIFYGCKAVRFIMGCNSNLKYGARLIHSFLGDNSTVSCCELLNNLIFPAHEQHHNNSFLIASLLMGQSNLASGATIGSNHNSRANDGEVQAGRGFWPGLSTTVKHYCRFASFVLLAKGDYPAELNILLPFSLLSDDRANDRLLVMPGYWWLYNMYALARNTWKFQARDKRQKKVQHIEFDCLAPDTVEELFRGLELLELWTGQAAQRRAGAADQADAAMRGRELLSGPEPGMAGLEVRGQDMEDSNRPVVMLKPYAGYQAYRQMILYYGVKNLLGWLQAHPQADLTALCAALQGPWQRNWMNLGGQLVPTEEVQRLIEDIKAGRVNSWGEVHSAYDRLWEGYPLAKQRHAYAALCARLGVAGLTADTWRAALQEAMRIQEYICEQVYLTRKKDYDDPFRQTTFRNATEQAAVLGNPEKNSFVKQVRAETEAFKAQAQAAMQRI